MSATSTKKRTAVSILLFVLTPLGTVFFGLASIAQGFGWLLGLLGVACFAGFVFLGVGQMRSLENDRAQFRLEVRDAMRPIARQIAQLPALGFEERAQRLHAIAQTCATALFMLISPHAKNMRANVFVLREGPDRMEWLAHVGRGKSPRPFLAGTRRGDAALNFITELQSSFYPDLQKAQPDGYEGSMTDYETFIAVPVWSDQAVHGLVTVDAPVAGSLTVADQHIVELVAELMSTAFAVANASPPEASPPLSGDAP